MSVASLDREQSSNVGPIDCHHGRTAPEKQRHLRCYAYCVSKGRFVGECIDLDIMVEEDSLRRAVRSLNEAIDGYLHVAFEGDPAGLVPRPSPLFRRFLYHYRIFVLRLFELFRRERPQKRIQIFEASLCS